MLSSKGSPVKGSTPTTSNAPAARRRKQLTEEQFKDDKFELKDFVEGLSRRIVFDAVRKERENKSDMGFETDTLNVVLDEAMQDLRILDNVFQRKLDDCLERCVDVEARFNERCASLLQVQADCASELHVLEASMSSSTASAVGIGERLAALSAQREAVEAAGEALRYVQELASWEDDVDRPQSQHGHEGGGEENIFFLSSSSSLSEKKRSVVWVDPERVHERTQVLKNVRVVLQGVETQQKKKGGGGEEKFGVTDNAGGGNSVGQNGNAQNSTSTRNTVEVSDRLRIALATMDTLSRQLQRQLLDRFRDAVQRADAREMQQTAQSLFDFDAGDACIDCFLQEAFGGGGTKKKKKDVLLSAMMGVPQSSSSSSSFASVSGEFGVQTVRKFFAQIKSVTDALQTTIEQVFPEPSVVTTTIVERIFSWTDDGGGGGKQMQMQQFALSIRSLLDRLKASLEKSNPELYLSLLAETHDKSIDLIEHFSKYSFDSSVSLPRLLDFVFSASRDTYLDKELALLESLGSAKLASFRGLLSPAVLEEHKRASRFPWEDLSMDSEKAKEISLEDLETTKFFLNYGRQALERCIKLSHQKDAAQNVTAIYRLLLRSFGSNCIARAVDMHLELMPDKPNIKKKMIDVTFFFVVLTMNTIMIDLERFHHVEVLPRVASSINEPTKCNTMKQKLVQHLEMKLSFGLQRLVRVMQAQLEALLSSLQRRRDYKPSSDAMVEGPTQACTSTCEFLEAHLAVVFSCIDGGNAELFAQNLGQAFYDTLFAHLKKCPVSTGVGGMQLTMDMTKYVETAKKFNIPSIEAQFASLRQLCNIHLVEEKSIKALIKDLTVVIPKADLIQYLTTHELYKASWISEDFGQVKVLYEWKALEFSGVPSGVPVNSSNWVVTGVKADLNGTVYVTVPRWKRGIPASLCSVAPDGKLVPFPSYEANDLFTGWIRYVQSMEIDSRNWMWILDVGRLNFYDEDPSALVNAPAKLVVYDLTKKCIVRFHVFPDSVLPYNNSFANDIVVDEVLGIAYIANTAGNGGIVVYDFNMDQSRRWDHPTFQGNPNGVIVESGVSYAVHAPSDGIAWNPMDDHLYYCSFSVPLLYRVPASILRNFSATQSDLDGAIVTIGRKGYSDGMVFDREGRLFYGHAEKNALMVWNYSMPLETAEPLFQDDHENQWVDTLGFHGRTLLWTSNRLLRYFHGTLSKTDANFRIFAAPTESYSYIRSGHPQPPNKQCVNKN